MVIKPLIIFCVYYWWFVCCIEDCASSELVPHQNIAREYLNVQRLQYESELQESYWVMKKSLAKSWYVLASNLVVPGSLYRVVVQTTITPIKDERESLVFSASLTHNRHQITSGSTTLEPGELSHVLLKVPDTSVEGDWHLIVQGNSGKSQREIFKNMTLLTFTSRFLNILIQTSRPVYNAGQTVRFRVILLNRSLKLYEEPVDIFVLDPRKRVMRRWPSRPSGDGVVSLNFDLPNYPLLGNWIIKVHVRSQIEEKVILVEQYFQPRFEVYVRLSETFKLTSKFIVGSVIANMTNWRDVIGNCSVLLQVATNDEAPIPTEFNTIDSQFVYNFTGSYSFNFSNDALRNYMKNNEDTIIRVLASVGDSFGWQIQQGWSLAKITEEKPIISILGDQPLFFWPGMPLTVQVYVRYSDEQSIEEEKLYSALLYVSFRGTPDSEYITNGSKLVETGGILGLTHNIPDDITSLEIYARYTDTDGVDISTKLLCKTHDQTSKRHLQVDTSTTQVNPGENIVLHVRSNFFITHINYIVISNGVILASGREIVEEPFMSVVTFCLVASSEMSPFASVIVWVADHEQQILAHAIQVPVIPLQKREFDIIWNEHKDHTIRTVELKMMDDTASYFATSAIWEDTYYLDTGHDLDYSRILNQMMKYGQTENVTMNRAPFNIRRANIRSNYETDSHIALFPTPNTGFDVLSTFLLNSLNLLTDPITAMELREARTHCELGFMSCLSGGCYKISDRCDGIPNCEDMSDEAGCAVAYGSKELNFRLHRTSRILRFYDPIEGDWGWEELRGAAGSEVIVLSVPKTPQTWIVSGLTMGAETGFGILTEKIKFVYPRPFLITVDAPSVARMWEQITLTVGLFNYLDKMVFAFVTLESSEYYRVIMVESKGVVDSYDPKKSDETFQHIVWLNAGQSTDVHIPISFTQMGDIEVTVKGSTQSMMDSETVVISVGPEGVGIGQHTSHLFDLKSRAVVYEFFDIHLDESPIIPYSLQRRYVFGTSEGHITISGDIVGPTFPVIPINEDVLLGFGAMGAETAAFNFASNIWTLHYLRLTNQISDEITYEVLTAVSVYYAEISRYQNTSGGFSNWIGAETSVWLTAHILRCLSSAIFQDWENLLFIDSSIFQEGVKFLLSHQDLSYGYFGETEDFEDTLEPKIRSPHSNENQKKKFTNIALTAQVIIAVSDILPMLWGDLRQEANVGLRKAVKYLERALPWLVDPYEVAVVAWALFKGDSDDNIFAFNSLDQIKRVDGDRIYWSRGEIAFNEIIYEDNQRPYLQPKGDNEWDAHSVEATAYALLVNIKNDGINNIQENIVRFLVAMRKSDGGLISTLDTLVALEALVEYSFRAHLRCITKIDVTVEPSGEPDSVYSLSITNSTGLSSPQEIELSNIFGHLSITGRGAGQAVLQLDYSYGVDTVDELDYPVVPSYEFDLKASFHGKNNSHMTITSCQRWINTQEDTTSGLTIVDIHLPSGYWITQDKLISMVLSRKVKDLRWAVVRDSNVLFFFNKISNEEVCFTYEIERWYPVANHSRYNGAVIYELYQPERFEMKLFEVFPLYTLDVCEVCGSFQCPYCPFYSANERIQISSAIFLLLLFYYIVLFIK